MGQVADSNMLLHLKGWSDNSLSHSARDLYGQYDLSDMEDNFYLKAGGSSGSNLSMDSFVFA